MAEKGAQWHRVWARSGEFLPRSSERAGAARSARLHDATCQLTAAIHAVVDPGQEGRREPRSRHRTPGEPLLPVRRGREPVAARASPRTSFDQLSWVLVAIPSRRHSSATLSAPRRPVQHDADLLLRGMLLPRAPPDVLHDGLGKRLRWSGFR
jgi:hypothetical protein